MSRPLVSIVFAAALWLVLPASAQSVGAEVDPDSASNQIDSPIPEISAPTSDVATPVPDSANRVVDPNPDSGSLQPSGIPVNLPRRSLRFDRDRRGVPTGAPVQSQDLNAGTPAPEPVVVPPAVYADLPFDEDSALEIKLKTDPEAARRYRSPRKAFFFSLLLPGAGQAYCGSWAKMTVFAAAEIGLAVGWYQIAVVASRDKANQAKRYATSHWSQGKYESNWQRVFTIDSSSLLRGASAPQRESYCLSLYGDGNDASESRQACVDAPANANYSQHDRQFGAGNSSSPDSVFAHIVQPDPFYDMIGRYSEFVPGWMDAQDTATPDGLRNYYNALIANTQDPTKPIPINPWGVSQMQANYRALRSRSDDLARTQKLFLGGMVLNHLVSALDAALQASRMNRTLLHLETTWIDRLEVGGGLAVAPQISSYASIAWRF